MTGLPFRLVVLCVVLFAAAPKLLAGALANNSPSNEQVDNKIDEITQPPAYDWLRNGDDPSQLSKPDKSENEKNQKNPNPNKRSNNRRPGNTEESSCDYKPTPGSNPGTRDSSPPATPSGGCQNPSPGMKCDCSPNIGDCGSSPKIGGCNCGGIGSGLAAPFGVAMAVLALGFIVFFIARAIIGREKKNNDDLIADLEDKDDPSRIRISEVAAVPSDTMMDRALRSAAAGDYKTAVGWCYLAGISTLHRRGFTTLSQATTNREIVSNTRKKKGPYKPSRRLVGIFEELFFGNRTPQENHWLECKTIVEDVLGKEATNQN